MHTYLLLVVVVVSSQKACNLASMEQLGGGTRGPARERKQEGCWMPIDQVPTQGESKTPKKKKAKVNLSNVESFLHKGNLVTVKSGLISPKEKKRLEKKLEKQAKKDERKKKQKQKKKKQEKKLLQQHQQRTESSPEISCRSNGSSSGRDGNDARVITIEDSPPHLHAQALSSSPAVVIID